MADNVNFVSHNIIGHQLYKKCIKIFEYLESKFRNNDIIFFKETHPSENVLNE